MELAEKDKELFGAVVSNDLDLAQLLLSSGANVNARDEAGHSPLVHAVEAENIEIATLLVKNGADLTVNYGEPDDPLHLFHYTYRGSSRSETGAPLHRFLWRHFRENVLQKRPLTAEETRALLDAYSDVGGHAAFYLKDGTLREGYFCIDENIDEVLFTWAPSPMNPASFNNVQESIPFSDIDLESLCW